MGGFQGCSQGKQRNNWCCVRTVPPEYCGRTPFLDVHDVVVPQGPWQSVSCEENLVWSKYAKPRQRPAPNSDEKEPLFQEQLQQDPYKHDVVCQWGSTCTQCYPCTDPSPCTSSCPSPCFCPSCCLLSIVCCCRAASLHEHPTCLRPLCLPRRSHSHTGLGLGASTKRKQGGGQRWVVG